MSSSLTEAVVARLRTVGAVPKEQDLYSGAGTDFYDRLVGSDRAEIREMLALARGTEGPILDVAAGSGRLTVPLVRSGKRVTAIDLSDDMLSRLRRTLPDHATLECVVADMRDFSLPQQFGLVIIGATSISCSIVWGGPSSTPLCDATSQLTASSPSRLPETPPRRASLCRQTARSRSPVLTARRPMCSLSRWKRMARRASSTGFASPTWWRAAT